LTKRERQYINRCSVVTGQLGNAGKVRESYKVCKIANLRNRRNIMNKTELVAAMAEQTQLSKKDAEAALKAFIDVVSEEMKKGEKVQLVGFGTFEVSERAAREGRNPATGESMVIKASKAPKFKAGKALKDLVNE
jgi:DNA-binding protein HU-beta